jgi:protein TonB
LDLDVYPRALTPVQLEYPAHALPERRMGEVSLAVRIDAAGQTQEVRIIEANPPGYFEESAMVAVRAARFAPAQKDGRNVRSEIVLRLVYDPPVQPSAAGTVSASPPEPAQ